MSGSYCDIASSSGGNQSPRIHSDMVSNLENFGTSPDQIYNLTANMEMNMVYNNHHPSSCRNLPQQQWRGFLNKMQPDDDGDPGPGPGPSTSKELNAPTPTSDHLYHHDLTGAIPTTNEAALAWININHHDNDDPCLRSCVFPCEAGTQRPTQGLSLSLNPSNPPTVTLQQPFELRHPPRLSPTSSHFVQQHSFVRNSKYLGPAQDLLSEFCNLGANQHKIMFQKKISYDNQDNEVNKLQSLHSLDLLQLQIRKTKLIQMLQEVDRRYNHYCDQMKGVVLSFEEVAGNGAAAVYSAMASRAMSRHFRCLRDAIITQMKATKKAIEAKTSTGATAPGAMAGETPRLKLIDQRLRQQKALQQMSLLETHPWRPQRGLPERSVSVLRSWLFEHFLHPYPSDVDKHILSRQTGLSRSQVSNWFINARVRLWKPMVEEMYTAELKDDAEENKGALRDQDRPNHDYRKPTLDQMVRKDSGSLSSIMNNNAEITEALETGMELDFSSYGGGGVSLTLGLHHHTGGGGGVRLAFPQASQSSALFYPRDQMETVHHHQYTLLENDHQSQNLPYRNLMGAQLLHDLAG